MASLPATTVDAKLGAALSQAFPGFAFTLARDGDEYWRDTRSILAPDSTRVAELRPWMTAELAKDHGDVKAVWKRLKDSDLKLTEWSGKRVFAFAPTGAGVADYVQITLCREIEARVGSIVDPRWPPYGEEELLDPSWIPHGSFSDDDVLAGPIYRLYGPAATSVVHLRSFLGRCARLERDRQAKLRERLERTVVSEQGPHGTREGPFLDVFPRSFDGSPREVRFFQDWEESSAHARRVFDFWAVEIHDYEHDGAHEVGFVPRPLKTPAEKLRPSDGTTVHMLMDRIEQIDQELGLPFSWFFLMTHGNWVEREVGEMIAEGIRQQRVRLPQGDERVLLRWVDRQYSF